MLLLQVWTTMRDRSGDEDVARHFAASHPRSETFASRLPLAEAMVALNAYREAHRATFTHLDMTADLIGVQYLPEAMDTETLRLAGIKLIEEMVDYVEVLDLSWREDAGLLDDDDKPGDDLTGRPTAAH